MSQDVSAFQNQFKIAAEHSISAAVEIFKTFTHGFNFGRELTRAEKFHAVAGMLDVRTDNQEKAIEEVRLALEIS